MPSPANKSKGRLRRLLHRIAAGVAALGAVVLVALAWHWQRTLPLRAVAVTGFTRADSAEVVRLASLPDSAALFSLDPEVVADRARRAPWVREARVRRRPTGVLQIAVEERAPAALVVGADGRPSHFLDAEGYSLPLRAHDPFDVPLLRGRVPAYHPTRPVESPVLLDLLAALATADAATDALVSELTVGAHGEVSLRTSPSEAHGALTVQLGAGGFAEKLRRLRAFWLEAVLSRPETQYRLVDLRFDGQVVTRETTAEPAPAQAGGRPPAADLRPANEAPPATDDSTRTTDH